MIGYIDNEYAFKLFKIDGARTFLDNIPMTELGDGNYKIAISTSDGVSIDGTVYYYVKDRNGNVVDSGEIDFTGQEYETHTITIHIPNSYDTFYLQLVAQQGVDVELRDNQGDQDSVYNFPTIEEDLPQGQNEITAFTLSKYDVINTLNTVTDTVIFSDDFSNTYSFPTAGKLILYANDFPFKAGATSAWISNGMTINPRGFTLVTDKQTGRGGIVTYSSITSLPNIPYEEDKVYALKPSSWNVKVTDTDRPDSFIFTGSNQDNVPVLMQYKPVAIRDGQTYIIPIVSESAVGDIHLVAWDVTSGGGSHLRVCTHKYGGSLIIYGHYNAPFYNYQEWDAHNGIMVLSVRGDYTYIAIYTDTGKILKQKFNTSYFFHVDHEYVFGIGVAMPNSTTEVRHGGIWVYDGLPEFGNLFTDVGRTNYLNFTIQSDITQTFILQEAQYEEEVGDTKVLVAGKEVGDTKISITGYEVGDTKISVAGYEIGDVKISLSSKENADIKVNVAGRETADTKILLSGEERSDVKIDLAGYEVADTKISLNGEERSDVKITLSGYETADVKVNLAGYEVSDTKITLQGEERSDIKVKIAGYEVADVKITLLEGEVADTKISIAGYEVGDTKISLSGEEKGDIEVNLAGNEIGDTKISLQGEEKADVKIEMLNYEVADVKISLLGEEKIDTKISIMGEEVADVKISLSGEEFADVIIGDHLEERSDTMVYILPNYPEITGIEEDDWQQKGIVEIRIPLLLVIEKGGMPNE